MPLWHQLMNQKPLFSISENYSQHCAQKLERQILRTACKRKAVDMISERPSKIINSELFKMDEENLEKKDLKYVRQSMYRERKKLQPANL
jgi:hypothetical protein